MGSSETAMPGASGANVRRRLYIFAAVLIVVFLVVLGLALAG